MEHSAAWCKHTLTCSQWQRTDTARIPPFELPRIGMKVADGMIFKLLPGFIAFNLRQAGCGVAGSDAGLIESGWEWLTAKHKDNHTKTEAYIDARRQRRRSPLSSSELSMPAPFAPSPHHKKMTASSTDTF